MKLTTSTFDVYQRRKEKDGLLTPTRFLIWRCRPPKFYDGKINQRREMELKFCIKLANVLVYEKYFITAAICLNLFCFFYFACSGRVWEQDRCQHQLTLFLSFFRGGGDLGGDGSEELSV